MSDKVASKDKKEHEIDLPTVYDFFYYDYSILQKIFDLDDIKKYSQTELNINLNQNLRGISYLYELILINIMNYLEGLISNYNASDIIHWSHSDIKEEAIRTLIQKDPIIKEIFELNKLRKDLSGIRTKPTTLNEKDISEFNILIKRYKTKVEEINKFLLDYLKIKIMREPTDIMPIIVNWFLKSYNYIEGDSTSVLEFKKERVVCTYPGGLPFFYIMPDEIRKNYYLQSPIIKNNSTEYFNGYKIMLLFFYKKCLANDKYEISKELLLQSKTWNDIHKAYGKISRITEHRNAFFQPLFKVTNASFNNEVISHSKIKEITELNLIFRRINNLRIKIIRSEDSIGEWAVGKLFFHILLGAKHVQGEEIEIIEFKQFYPERNDIEFSYAIFIPIQGMFTDASFWMFFDKLALESITGGYQSNGKPSMDAIIKKLSKTKDYIFKSYEIQGDLLKAYIKNKDMIERNLSELHEKEKISKGLLGQFTAYLYLAKKYGAKLKDISKNINTTDIDVIAENDESLFLVQAKSSFPLTKESLKYLRSHFKLIEKEIKTDKKIQKILFLLEDTIDNNDTTMYMIESNISSISKDDMDDTVEKISKKLESEGIITIYYKDLRALLPKKEYAKFISDVDKVIDYMEFPDF